MRTDENTEDLVFNPWEILEPNSQAEVAYLRMMHDKDNEKLNGVIEPQKEVRK